MSAPTLRSIPFEMEVVLDANERNYVEISLEWCYP